MDASKYLGKNFFITTISVTPYFLREKRVGLFIAPSLTKQGSNFCSPFFQVS